MLQSYYDRAWLTLYYWLNPVTPDTRLMGDEEVLSTNRELVAGDYRRRLSGDKREREGCKADLRASWYEVTQELGLTFKYKC